VQNADQNEASSLIDAALAQAMPLLKRIEEEIVDAIRAGNIEAPLRADGSSMQGLTYLLGVATLNLSLLGRAQVWTEVADRDRAPAPSSAPPFGAVVLQAGFEPLAFDEALDFFRDKVSLSPEEYAVLSDLARQKAFSIAAGATEQIISAIRSLLEEALSEGVTVKEFQARAAEVVAKAGVAARSPWYWETVYRTNLQTSYQAGRWKQITDPYVRARRPYLRYVSALVPTTRPSHREKHGLIYPVDHPFWDRWMPPNGFNCLCTVVTVSESLLQRRGWSVSDTMDFAFADPDAGFDVNPGATEVI
jgi:SPP1 gp7 family putative phage head morphogenesis protein